VLDIGCNRSDFSGIAPNVSDRAHRAASRSRELENRCTANRTGGLNPSPPAMRSARLATRNVVLGWQRSLACL
jgi:hypothetical protein